MKAAPITSLVSVWRFPPETLVLGCDEVHVWRAALDQQTPSQIQSFLHNLSADEQARARRFHFQRDRERFIVARGVLRAILADYLNKAPEGLPFVTALMENPPLQKNLIGMGPALACPTLRKSPFMRSVVVVRWASILSISGSIWQSWRSPSDFSHDGRLRHSGHFQRTCSNRHSFTVGRARRPTSRPGAKDFHCPWISLMCRWLLGNQPQYSVINEIHPKPPVGLFRNSSRPPAMSLL